MMVGLSVFASLVGFACLALAMDRHHRQVLSKALSPDRRRRLRIAGGLGIAASYLFIIVGFGTAIGTIAWFAVLSLGAATVLLTISAKDNVK